MAKNENSSKIKDNGSKGEVKNRNLNGDKVLGWIPSTDTTTTPPKKGDKNK
jgi:hypothetical protein